MLATHPAVYTQPIRPARSYYSPALYIWGEHLMNFSFVILYANLGTNTWNLLDITTLVLYFLLDMYGTVREQYDFSSIIY